MLKRRYRVPLEGSFMKRSTVLAVSPYFDIRFQKNSLGFNRIAVVISKKAVPGSVRRHYLKRRILTSAALLPRVEKDMVFIVRGACNTVSPANLTLAMKKTEQLILKI